MRKSEFYGQSVEPGAISRRPIPGDLALLIYGALILVLAFEPLRNECLHQVSNRKVCQVAIFFSIRVGASAPPRDKQA